MLWPIVSKSPGLLAASLAPAVLGVPLGSWAARRRHSNASLITLIGSLAGMSLPRFFVAMIDRVGVGFTRVINRTTVAAGLVFVLGIQWAGHYVGPSTYCRRYASAFDGQRALALMVMGQEENY